MSTYPQRLAIVARRFLPTMQEVIGGIVRGWFQNMGELMVMIVRDSAKAFVDAALVAAHLGALLLVFIVLGLCTLFWYWAIPIIVGASLLLIFGVAADGMIDINVED